MINIYTILKGGLGNQLFTYASARRLAIKNNSNLILNSKFGFYKDTTFNRNFELSNFYLTDNIHNNINKSNHNLNKIQRKFLIIYSNLFKINNRKYILENNNINFDDIINLNLQKNIFFEGYWQNEIYFKDTKNILIKELSLKISLNDENKNLLNKIKKTNSVCIHIRNYDQNKISIKNNIPIEYYKNAISYLESKFNNLHFYIFSDSNYLDMTFLNKKSTIVDINLKNNEDFYDLELMKNCNFLILANSSFSWWAGWLCNHNNVIYTDMKKYNSTSLYNPKMLDSWTMI